MSPQSITDIFSQEIIDKIIDHLAGLLHVDPWSGRHSKTPSARLRRSGLSYLRSASLVCRGFRGRCQFHILRVLDLSIDVSSLRSLIKIERPHRRERMHGLPHLLRERRHLAGGPMSFSLFFDHSGTLAYDEGLKYDVKKDEDLVQLLQYFRDDTIMQITQLDIGSTNMYRQSEYPLLSILPLIDLNNISKLVLDTLSVVPLSLFSGCPRLSDLVLNSVVIEQRGASVGVHGPVPERQQVIPILQHLYHTYVGIGLDLIHDETRNSPVVDITHLRTLGVRMNIRNSNHPDFLRGMTPVYSHLAALCGEHLRELHIRTDKQAGWRVPPLELNGFRALHTIWIDIEWMDGAPPVFPVQGLCEWLAQLPPNKTLHTIMITFDVGLWKTSPNDFIYSEWDLLNQTLTTIFASADIAKVSFSVSSAGPTPACSWDAPPEWYLGPEGWPSGAPMKSDEAQRLRRMNHFAFDVVMREKLESALRPSSPKIKFSFKFVEYWL